MVGGKIIDCQQHIAIFFEAADSLVVFGFVKFDEMIKGRQGILACLGHLDVLQGGLGLLFGSLLSTFAVLWTQQRCSRTLLQTLPTAFQKPRAPSATTSLGAKSRPRCFRSSSSSFHNKGLPRMPSVNPTSSLLPSGFAPDDEDAVRPVLEPGLAKLS